MKQVVSQRASDSCHSRAILAVFLYTLYFLYYLQYIVLALEYQLIQTFDFPELDGNKQSLWNKSEYINIAIQCQNCSCHPFSQLLMKIYPHCLLYYGPTVSSCSCHIHKIALSSTLDLRSHAHQLRSTFAQLAVRTLQTSLYILLHCVPCTFDPSVLDSLLGVHHSCVELQTQLQLYFSSISAFIHIEYNPNSVSIYKLNVLST